MLAYGSVSKTKCSPIHSQVSSWLCHICASIHIFIRLQNAAVSNFADVSFSDNKASNCGRKIYTPGDLWPRGDWVRVKSVYPTNSSDVPWKASSLHQWCSSIVILPGHCHQEMTSAHCKSWCAVLVCFQSGARQKLLPRAWRGRQPFQTVKDVPWLCILPTQGNYRPGSPFQGVLPPRSCLLARSVPPLAQFQLYRVSSAIPTSSWCISQLVFHPFDRRQQLKLQQMPNHSPLPGQSQDIS